MIFQRNTHNNEPPASQGSASPSRRSLLARANNSNNVTNNISNRSIGIGAQNNTTVHNGPSTFERVERPTYTQPDYQAPPRTQADGTQHNGPSTFERVERPTYTQPDYQAPPRTQADGTQHNGPSTFERVERPTYTQPSYESKPSSQTNTTTHNGPPPNKKAGNQPEVEVPPDPGTTFRIEDFYALATKVDFARLHQLRIVEWVWFGKRVIPTDDYHLYLETASLPGREIANLSVPYIGMNFNVPGLVSYGGAAAYNVTFRCDQTYLLRDIFEQQTRTTHNDTDSNGNNMTPGEDSYLVLGLVGKQLEIIRNYKLVGVRVINTGTIQYNLGDAGTIAKLDVTLAYHYWTQDPVGKSK